MTTEHGPMIEVAQRVLAWRAAGAPAALARTVSVQGMSSRWPDEVLAATADDSAGSLLGGSADADLLPTLRDVAAGGGARQLDLVVGDAEAIAAGLACGGRATVLVQPVDDVPAAAWHSLASRDPLGLVSPLAGGPTTVVGPAELAGHGDADPVVRRFVGQGISQTAAVRTQAGADVLVTATWPPCRLLVLGEGHLAAALAEVCALMGFTSSAHRDTDTGSALDVVDSLGAGDAVVVLSHDIEASSQVLARALGRRVGYVGALGSHGTQAKRRAWLLDHGVEQAVADTVRGPAGLDVGARTPGQIAVAVGAELLAVRSGTGAGPLRDRPGPVHA